MLQPNPEVTHIDITAGRTSPPTCLITWNARELVLDCATVRRLAADMVAAAARAEAEAAVTAVLQESGVGDQVIGAWLISLRSKYANHGFGIKGTLTFIPSVSLFDGRPFAHANIAPYEPLRLDPDTLRQTAADWLQVAESAERDAILAYALREATDLTAEQINQVFITGRNVRPDGLHDNERNES
jgi:hypothetical protein